MSLLASADNWRSFLRAAYLWVDVAIWVGKVAYRVVKDFHGTETFEVGYEQIGYYVICRMRHDLDGATIVVGQHGSNLSEGQDRAERLDATAITQVNDLLRHFDGKITAHVIYVSGECSYAYPAFGQRAFKSLGYGTARE
jgi:hypothetical protein